jgi:hypothetical protein
MAVVRILAAYLTGPGRQQVLQGAKTVLDLPATLPRPYEARCADGRVETYHVELLLPGLTDHDERHRAIRRTGRPQPGIAHAGDLRAMTPWPIAWRLQIAPLDLAPIGQLEDIRALTHVIQAPSPLCERCHRCLTRSQDFLISLVTHVRYKGVRAAVPIPTPSSACLIGIGRVGDDL